jgi:hypothetical protein
LLNFFDLQIKNKSIPEIIPTTAKGLIGSTPNVTNSPVIGAFCDDT